MKNQKILKPMAIGVVLGMLIFAAIIFISMPKMMLVVHQSRYDTVEETCDRLKKSIEAQGWSFPGIRNMNASSAKQGVDLGRQVRIVELCKAEYAKEVIATNPEVSTLMPCAWGVYEGDDGKVYISGMNIGLMGKMFGGTIAKVMGGSVSVDESKILEGIVL